MFVLRVTLAPGVLHGLDKLSPPVASRCVIHSANSDEQPGQDQTPVRLVDWDT